MIINHVQKKRICITINHVRSEYNRHEKYTIISINTIIGINIQNIL